MSTNGLKTLLSIFKLNDIIRVQINSKLLKAILIKDFQT